ncbi:MAG: ribonuclease P protein component [Bryobacteraceae bacterium]
MNGPSDTPTPIKPDGAAKRKLSFPKSARILRRPDFREVYDRGFRVSGPFFAAFCLLRPEAQTPRIGFTTPRALGKAVVRNRLKRRIRETVRCHLSELEPQWDIVINPRRAALAAKPEDLVREVRRLFGRCKA